MRDHAVVLTYPGHFLPTQLTLLSIKEHFPEITKYTVLIDDIGLPDKQEYLNKCLRLYQCDVVALSKFKFLNEFRGDAWIRQQIVKLYLDVILEVENWFFSDGDIGFTSHISEGVVPYGYASILEHDVRSDCEDRYLKEMLKLEIKKESNHFGKVCTSVAAFRDMSSCTLLDLRNYVEKHAGIGFMDLHLEIMKNPKYVMSEWELIEHFRTHVQHVSSDWLFCPPRDYSEYFNTISSGHPQPYFYTFYENNETVNTDFWTRVLEHKKANKIRHSALTY